MPTINLIYEQRLQAKAVERKLKAGIMAIVGLGGLCFLATTFLMVDATRLHFEASALERKKKDLEPLLAELDANQTLLNELSPRLQTLTKAQDFTQKWSLILDHLTVNTPPGTWLTNVKASQTDKAKPLQVTLNGQSITNENIGNLMLRLETSEMLENVQLKFTNERPGQDGAKSLDFEIIADLSGSKEKEPEKPKETS
ncbi:MAG: PilN domain-containing protein [Fimbriimonadaceae bacterium]|jgi:Tfp pilus assembly protein PilN|nr:PilN domain-containing protein [Fimbriimonadaceae bacterium]